MGSPRIKIKMMFDWTLFFNWFDDFTDAVPCMSGGLFAISVPWWHESGEYDYDMRMWGNNTDTSAKQLHGRIITARTHVLPLPGLAKNDQFP